MAGLTEIKANSASQQSWGWSWGLAELGNYSRSGGKTTSFYVLYPDLSWGDNHLLLSKITISPERKCIWGGGRIVPPKEKICPWAILGRNSLQVDKTSLG